MHTIVCCRSVMIDLTNLPAESLHHACKLSTDSATTFTALRNVNTTTRTDKLSACLLVVDLIRTYNLSRQEAADLRLIPRSHWGVRYVFYRKINTIKINLIY